MRDKKGRWFKWVALVAIVAVIGFGAFYLNDFRQYKKKVADITLQPFEIQKVSDGVYEGESDAGFVYAKVKVTVAGGVIEDIAILEHKHERGEAAESVVKGIVSSQQFPVDAVSGATNSSKVIQNAVQNAVSKGLR